MLNSDWCNIHIFNNWTNSCCLYGCMHKWSLYLTTPCMQSCWSHFRRILEVKQRYVGQPSLPISTVHKRCLWTVSTGRDYSVNSIWTWREHRFRSTCEVLYHCLILLQGTAFHWWLCFLGASVWVTLQSCCGPVRFVVRTPSSPRGCITSGCLDSDVISILLEILRYEFQNYRSEWGWIYSNGFLIFEGYKLAA